MLGTLHRRCESNTPSRGRPLNERIDAMFHRAVLVVAALGLVGSGLAVRAETPASSLGKKVAGFTLTDPRDQRQVSLADFRDKKAVVVLFLGTECPVNNAYMLTLPELHKRYAAKGVEFVGINANLQDTAERVAA